MNSPLLSASPSTITDRVLAFTLPMTSTLVIPGVQGTIPAYLMGMISIAVVVAQWSERETSRCRGYLRDWLLLALFFSILLFFSQLGHFLNDQNPLSGFAFISEDGGIVMRSSLYTQSLYLFACFAIFTYVRHWLAEENMVWIFRGIWFLVIYGIYEWLYFLIFKTPGDFLANRTYDGHTGSWTQSVNVAGVHMMRIKSTFGEPSFLSAATVPFFMVTIIQGKRFLAGALLFCIVFSWSTTAFAGVIFGFLVIGLLNLEKLQQILLVLVGTTLALLLFYLVLPDTFNSMFIDKITGKNESGAIRLNARAGFNSASEQRHLLNDFFGIGFGYVYNNIWKAARINLGYLGAIVIALFHLWPMCKSLIERRRNTEWAVAAAVLFFLGVINLAENFVPTTWAILALAYRALDQQEPEKKRSR